MMARLDPVSYANFLGVIHRAVEKSGYLEEFGHVQSADQYIALKEGERLGRLKSGDLAVLVAARIGYTWGATVVRWG